MKIEKTQVKRGTYIIRVARKDSCCCYKCNKF